MIDNVIQVKKERDVEESLGIKFEKESPKSIGTLSKKRASISTDTSPWLHEKKRLIEKIVALQTENQRVTFDLQNKISQHEASIQEKVNIEQQLSEKVHKLTEELKTTHSQAAVVKSNFAEQNNRDKETIAQLTYENKTLQARVNQLQFGIAQQKGSKDDDERKQSEDEDYEVYDVEDLIKHKTKKNVMYYLVRWKNFTPNDDTWEREDNLMCSEILESYKRKNNL